MKWLPVIIVFILSIVVICLNIHKAPSNVIEIEDVCGGICHLKSQSEQPLERRKSIGGIQSPNQLPIVLNVDGKRYKWNGQEWLEQR